MTHRCEHRVSPTGPALRTGLRCGHQAGYFEVETADTCKRNYEIRKWLTVDGKKNPMPIDDYVNCVRDSGDSWWAFFDIMRDQNMYSNPPDLCAAQAVHELGPGERLVIGCPPPRLAGQMDLS